jgi:hypothetical protein
MGSRLHRRAFVAALMAVTLSACGEPIAPPALAMRFEITRESLDEIESALSGYASRNRYKFETFQGPTDRSFSLHNEHMRIEMGAGAWNEPAYNTHEWPFEYQVDFYPADRSVNLDALAREMGSLLAAIEGVRKSGPNFVPDKDGSEPASP